MTRVIENKIDLQPKKAGQLLLVPFSVISSNTLFPLHHCAITFSSPLHTTLSISFKRHSLHLLRELVGATFCPSFKVLLTFNLLSNLVEIHQPRPLGHFISFQVGVSTCRRAWWQSSEPPASRPSGWFHCRVLQHSSFLPFSL